MEQDERDTDDEGENNRRQAGDTLEAHKGVPATAAVDVSLLTPEKEKEYREIVSFLKAGQTVSTPLDHLLVNRAAKTLMIMKDADAWIDKHGIFREETDQNGRVSVKISEIARIHVELNKEFRAFARTIQGYKMLTKANTETNDISQWIQDANTNKRKKAHK